MNVLLITVDGNPVRELSKADLLDQKKHISFFNADVPQPQDVLNKVKLLQSEKGA